MLIIQIDWIDYGKWMNINTLSFVKGAEKGSSSFDPMRLLSLGLTYNGNNIVGWMTSGRKGACSLLCLIERAVVVGVVKLKFCWLNWLEVNDGDLAVNNIWRGLFNARALKIDTTSFRVKAIDQATICRSCLCQLFFSLLPEDKGKAKWIYWILSFSGIYLKNRSQESLREKESRNPINFRFLQKTLLDKFNSFQEILKPRGKGFGWRIGSFFPLFGYLIEIDSNKYFLQDVSHDGFSFYCLY